MVAFFPRFNNNVAGAYREFKLRRKTGSGCFYHSDHPIDAGKWHHDRSGGRWESEGELFILVRRSAAWFGFVRSNHVDISGWQRRLPGAGSIQRIAGCGNVDVAQWHWIVRDSARYENYRLHDGL